MELHTARCAVCNLSTTPSVIAYSKHKNIGDLIIRSKSKLHQTMSSFVSSAQVWISSSNLVNSVRTSGVRTCSRSQESGMSSSTSKSSSSFGCCIVSRNAGMSEAVRNCLRGHTIPSLAKHVNGI